MFIKNLVEFKKEMDESDKRIANERSLETGEPETYGPTFETFFQPPEKCFICHKILGNDNLVMWSGESQIWMHQECVKPLIHGLHIDYGRDKTSEFDKQIMKTRVQALEL